MKTIRPQWNWFEKKTRKNNTCSNLQKQPKILNHRQNDQTSYQEKGTNKKKLKNIAVVHSLICQRQSYLSWYVPLPALHSVFVSVSVLHNISGSVDLLPRREDMVSVNSDCFSGSAASSEERKKKTPQNISHYFNGCTPSHNLHH